LRTIFHRKFKGTPKTVTVVSTLTGKFFISIVVEDGKTPPVKQRATSKTSVGIDVGLKNFVTISTGEKIENPQYLISSLKRVLCLQKRLSKKKKWSKNRAKARQRLAKCHERIANQRNDFQQKLSTQLIRENQAIIMESLNVSGMVKNHRLAKRISDAAWSRFLNMLKYKAEWFGVTIIQVGMFEPTSKLCHVCGHKNLNLTLSDREWTCPVCTMHHDRDINAAQNIKMIGLSSIITPREPREEPVELSALAETSKQETPTFKVG
jgi:putative transposase